MGSTLLERTKQRNVLAAIAPVSQKILVGRENDGVTFDFRQSHEAGVGKRHQHIALLLQMAKDFSGLLAVGEIRTREDQPIAQQFNKDGSATTNA
jgi:hypothetical protein